jgi:hypothetical protein
MAHRERQLDAALDEVQPPAAAHLVVAVPDVQVGMAHTGREHFHQHLRALWHWRFALGELERRAALADLVAAHSHGETPVRGWMAL